MNSVPKLQPADGDGEQHKKVAPATRREGSGERKKQTPSVPEQTLEEQVESGEVVTSLKTQKEIPQEFFEPTAEDIKARVQKAMEPLVLDAGDIFTKKGKELVDEKLGSKFLGVIESGGKNLAGVKTNFEGSNIFGFTSPGLKKINGEYPENRDGFVIAKTSGGKGIRVLMTHAVNDGPEAASLTNAASVSIAYELQKLHPQHLNDVFDLANDQVNAMKTELDVPNERVAMLGATIQKHMKESPLYEVDILSAGNIHCFLVEKLTGKVTKTMPQTVSGNLEEEQLPMGRRKELLNQWSQETGIPSEQIERDVTMAAGTERFRPVTTLLHAAPGEILVIASSDFMQSFGGHEYFQDSTMGKILAARLQDGEKLGDIIADLTKNIIQRQKDGKIEETPVSVVAFEIPGPKISQPKAKKPEPTVQELLKTQRIPLEMDFSDL